MEQRLVEQLQATQESFHQLSQNFQNNLKVIEELEEQNNLLRIQIQRINEEANIDKENFKHQIVSAHEKQFTELQEKCEAKIQSLKQAHQLQIDQMFRLSTEKMKSQLVNQKKKYTTQIQSMKMEIQKLAGQNQALSLQNKRLKQVSTQLKIQNQRLQSEMNSLIFQRQNINQKFKLHQQQIETIKNSNQQWEALLKIKVKQLQQDKQKLEQQYSDQRLIWKEKIKKIKQDQVTKIEKITNDKQAQVRQIMQDFKEVKYYYENSLRQNEKLKEQNDKNSIQIAALKEGIKKEESSRKASKEQQYIQKIYQQQKQYLKNQIDALVQEVKQLKEQLSETNLRREQAQIKFERLKVVHKNQQDNITQLQNQLKKFNRNQNVPKNKIQEQNIQYSKLYSEDLGYVGDDFFNMEKSVQRSPMNFNKSVKLSALQMKKNAQLQLQISQYKDVIKQISDQLRRIKDSTNEKLDMKDKEIRLCRDETQLYRQKYNQRELQVLKQKEIIGNFRIQIQKLLKHKDQKQKISQELETLKIQIQKSTKQNIQNRKKYEYLYEQSENVKQQRNNLEIISSDLRAQIHDLRQKICSLQNSHYQINQSQQQFEIQPTNYLYSSGQRSEQKAQKFPTTNKLYQLIKQRKKLQLVGNKAPVSQKQIEKRPQHTGTISQKRVYQNITRKSKTPPKAGINYNALLGRHEIQYKQQY